MGRGCLRLEDQHSQVPTVKELLHDNRRMPEVEKSYWKVPLEKQLEENKDIRLEDIKRLKEWLQKQPHLPQITDEQLSVFLGACNYSMEQSKRAIEINYTIRTRQPKMFQNRDLEKREMDIVKKYFQFGVTPYTKGRPVVIYAGLRPMDVSVYDVEVLLRAAYMLQDATHLLYGPVPEGYRFIFDFTNVTLGHLLRTPLPICSVTLKYAQEGSCCKIAGMHFMNAGIVVDKFLTMVRPFISPQLWNMIRTHEKLNGLDEFLEEHEIVRDYDGGKGPSLDELSEKSLEYLKEFREWYRWEEGLRVKEELRPADSKPLLDDGIQGSFRKLEID